MFLLFTYCIIALVWMCSNVNGYLNMDISWVLQGKSFGFQGFFIEFLGISSVLQVSFPQLRFQQAVFLNTMQDSPEQNMTLFKSLLFEKESSALSQMMSNQYSYSHSYPLLKSLFTNRYLNLPNRTGCRDCSITRGIVVKGGSMAKSELNNVNENMCCNACRAQQLCIAWQFIGNDGGNGVCSLKSYVPNSEDYHLSIMKNANGVFGILGSVKEWQNFVDKMAKKDPTSALKLDAGNIPAAEVRYSAPRVVILHGTSCVHQNETIKYRDINTIWVGRYMLERGELVKSINLDEYSVTACSAMVDEVWVPTEWHKAHLTIILKKMGYSSMPPIYVIPEAVDVTLFDPNSVGMGVQPIVNSVEMNTAGTGANAVTALINSNISVPFVFLSVFKWEYRKGWDVLLDSYWNAFSPSDPVELHIHTYVPSFERGTANVTYRIEAHAKFVFGVESLDQLAKVVWVNGPSHGNVEKDTTPGIEQKNTNADSRADMRRLLASADAFVLPTRGEGWGLPIAEAMAMALPVIVTNCSGPMAYLTEENSYIIPIEKELDEYGYARPDEKVLTELLRTVFNNEKKFARSGAKSAKGVAARETMKSISPALVVDIIEKRLRALAEMRGWKM